MRKLMVVRCDSRRVIGLRTTDNAITMVPVGDRVVGQWPGMTWRTVQCEQPLGHREPASISGFHAYAELGHSYGWGHRPPHRVPLESIEVYPF